MSMSAGAKTLLRETALWLTVIAAGGTGFYFYGGSLGDLAGTMKNLTAKLERSATPADTSNDNRSSQSRYAGRKVVLQAGRNGHFDVRARLNGTPVDLMADTGASLVVLRYKDAMKIGIAGGLRYTGRARTANGESKIAPVTLRKVSVDGIDVWNVRAAVAEPGKLGVSLLGMSFIGALRSFEMSGNRLVLVQ